MLFLISVMGYCKRFDSLKIYRSGLKKVYDRLFCFGERSKKDARAMPFINLCSYIFAGKDLPINAERIMKFLVITVRSEGFLGPLRRALSGV